MVSFDHDAHPGQALAPFQPASAHRANVLAAITGLSPGGATSIGDGVELARTTLTAGAAPFSGHALVVLTDGLENQPKLLSEVTGSIDTRTFAVGLGTAQQVSTEALSAIANGTGGFILLTGPLTPDTDSYFLLSKYFQQILIAATNENVVTDPSGFLAPGQRSRIPFTLADSDIDATAVVLVDVPAVRLALETPAGATLREAQLSALGAQVVHGTNMTFCRIALPLPGGPGAHGGSWHVVLEVDDVRLKREIARMARDVEQGRVPRVDLERVRAHGPRYAVTVSSWSNLRMSARLTQTGFTAGATLRLSAVLTEYGVPLERRARATAEILRPDGILLTRPLVEETAGAFAGEVTAALDGVWRVRVRAAGRAHGGRPFTREQLLSAAILVGGVRPPPAPSRGRRCARLPD